MKEELVIHSIGQAFNYASAALVHIRFLNITQERYEELKEFYLDMHKIAVEAGETLPWPHNTLPERLEDARLWLEFPYHYN